MPRKIQGRVARSKDEGVGISALPTQCQGEDGRDYLRRYFASSPFAQGVLRDLDEQGYCVLPRVFSPAEADEEMERAWGFVTRVSPTVKREDWNTWWPSFSGAPDPWPMAQRDMMQLHQAGWLFSDLRERFAARVYEPLYGTKDLHVSKDGFTFQRPTGREIHRSPNDHFDQGGLWMGLQCVQGSVALTDQSEIDGCFQVWPGSHLHREEILSAPRHQGRGKHKDFIILSQDERDLLESYGISPRRVPVRRGDVILWRSDVCHCGAPPLGRCDTMRLVAYVCCLPATLTPEPVYAQKQRAYERLETGCHYPNREEWFEMADRRKKLEFRPYFPALPKLSRRQQELYGLVRYPAAAEVGDGNDGETADAAAAAKGEDKENAAPRPAVEVEEAALWPALGVETAAPPKPRRWGAKKK